MRTKAKADKQCENRLASRNERTLSRMVVEHAVTTTKVGVGSDLCLSKIRDRTLLM